MVIRELRRPALFGVAIALVGCSAEASPASQPSVGRASGAALGPEHWLLFGSSVHEGACVPIEDVLAAPATFVGKDLRIDGAVATVDPDGGRWLVLGNAAVSVRITFKDDGFSVPADSEGREAILEGRLQVAKVDSDEPSYTFVADGLALRRTAAK